jgi:ADP-ribose pyrophosphatase YjhB (NUDIX family)
VESCKKTLRCRNKQEERRTPLDAKTAIGKPWYPEGMHRAPSGGIKPGEDMELCAKREAYEETGVKIKLVRYLLRIQVTFTCGHASQNWTSHVFGAQYLSG